MASSERFTFPSWINTEFISEILFKERGVDTSVLRFNFEDVVPKGDNFLSTLFRLDVEYKETKEGDTKHYFMILKALPESEMMLKFLSELDGFRKELCMYTTVFPAIYRIMKEAKGHVHVLSPRCLYSDEESLIVLEDLKQFGYKMAVRQEGLDLEHCRITLRALARLHAASFALYKSDPSIMDVFEEGMFKDTVENRKFRQSLFNVNINSLASKVETWDGYERFGPKLRELIPTAVDSMIEAVTPKENSFNVLNHGDCWVNNMLFRYCPQTGKVEDMRFVDFQVARFTSPALDLQYFIINSATDDLRFNQMEDLLEEYYSELADFMKALKLEAHLISLQKLKDEYHEKDMFGLLNACTVLCLVLAQKDDIPHMGNIKKDHAEKSGQSLLDKAYSGKRYREVFQKLLIYYENKGVI